VQRALTARSKGNAAVFLAAWDFDYQLTSQANRDHLVREQVRLAHNAPILPNFLMRGYIYPTVGVATYHPGYRSRITGVYTYRAGDTFPPKEPCEFTTTIEYKRREPDGKYHPYSVDID